MTERGSALMEREGFNDDDITIIDNSGAGLMEAQTRGEIDIQISTARRFPRSIRLFRDTALEMATLDEPTADSCFYVLPRSGKNIEGPSVRLAEICASAWGHMRVESRVVAEDEKFLVARAAAWDLQNNVAISIEVRRRITDKGGKRYNDDMISTTANAAISIALRNAVFKVIPAAYTRAIYMECRRVAIGDAATLADKRAKVLVALAKMGATNDRVFMMLGIRGEEDITLDHLGTLKGIGTAIRDGDTTVDEAFPLPGAVAAELKPESKLAETVKRATKKQEAPVAEAAQEPISAPPLSGREQFRNAANAMNYPVQGDEDVRLLAVQFLGIDRDTVLTDEQYIAAIAELPKPGPNEKLFDDQ